MAVGVDKEVEIEEEVKVKGKVEEMVIGWNRHIIIEEIAIALSTQMVTMVLIKQNKEKCVV